MPWSEVRNRRDVNQKNKDHLSSLLIVRFPSLPSYTWSCEIRTVHYTWSLRKVYSLRGERSNIVHSREYPSPTHATIFIGVHQYNSSKLPGHTGLCKFVQKISKDIWSLGKWNRNETWRSVFLISLAWQRNIKCKCNRSILAWPKAHKYT